MPLKTTDFPNEPGYYWVWCDNFGKAMVMQWPENKTLWEEYGRWWVPVKLDTIVEEYEKHVQWRLL